MNRSFVWGAALFALLVVAGLAYWAGSAISKNSVDHVGIDPAKVTEHLHAVIEANRTVYATHVVEKMQEKGIVEAAEHWKQEAALPLPAQFLMETGRMAAEKGSGVKYRLVSLWPIYVWNAPSTDFERKGLEAVSKDPDQAYTGFVKNGRSRSFQAIYADVAISQACIDCHNTHPNSPRRDFKLKDVMGGIVITIPIDAK
jgi:hypothetical protein